MISLKEASDLDDFLSCDICNRGCGDVKECDECGFRFHKVCNKGLKCKQCREKE